MSRPTAARARARAGARRQADRTVDRVRVTAWPIVQCALASSVAWTLAQGLLDHPAPVFAAVAAAVCLGVSYGHRLRRTVELAAGVTIGVGLGDLLVSQIGRGGWQIGVVVGLGMAFAQLLGGGALISAQAGLQGIFLIALPQPDAGLGRWLDALIGGAIALAVAALLPPDPERGVRARARELVTELAGVVRLASAAMRSGRSELADAALERARATQSDLDDWGSALSDGEEIARISPLRRRHRGALARHRRTLTGVDRAARNMRVAVRRIAASLDVGDRLPLPVADVLDEFAVALDVMLRHAGEPSGDAELLEVLQALAARLDPVELCADSLSATVVVAQLRSAVVDLLGTAGVEVERARALLPR